MQADNVGVVLQPEPQTIPAGSECARGQALQAPRPREQARRVCGTERLASAAPLLGVPKGCPRRRDAPMSMGWPILGSKMETKERQYAFKSNKVPGARS